MKKVLLMIISSVTFALLLSNSAIAGTMWKCVSTDARGATWYQYGNTRAVAASGARERCRAGSYRPTCSVRCYAPSSRWRCVSVDNAGKTWYWVSPVKSTAIANARTACVHNSTVGGCRVSPGSCSSS